MGGLAHILLPSRSLSRVGDNPGRFPQTAVPALVEEMAALGADRRRLIARLVGGASMFSNLVPAGSIQMGDRNVIAVREVLQPHGHSRRGRGGWRDPGPLGLVPGRGGTDHRAGGRAA